MEMADYQIENNKDLSHLYEEIQLVVSTIAKNTRRSRKHYLNECWRHPGEGRDPVYNHKFEILV